MGSEKDFLAKKVRRLRRKRHVRNRVFGTAEKPRMTVSRSHRNMSCQLIDDLGGRTLVAASTLEKEVVGELGGYAGNIRAAAVVGRKVAERARALGIEKVQFDRNGYKFHGRVKALAEGAREGGLNF